MTRKARVRAAIEHREPDLVPVGEWIIDYEPVSQVLGRPSWLRGKLGLIRAMWEGRRDEVVGANARDLVEVTRRLDMDLVCCDLTWPKGTTYETPEQVDAETWRDRHGNVFRYSDLTRDLMLLERGTRGWEPPKPERWANGELTPDPSELEIIRHVLGELGETHFTFTAMGDARLPISDAQGTEREMWALIEDPDQFAEDRMEGYAALAKRIPFFKRLGFDAVLLGDDFGHNKGPFMSPATFKRVYFPALQHVCEVAHANDMFLLCHSCGNLRLLLPLMIEAGIDAYQAIQPIEDIASLKRDFGKDLCLWGGVSNHDLVVSGPEEIRRQVKHAMETCAPGGGFILGSSHSMTVRSKLENIVAMLEAAGRHPEPAGR